MDPKAIKLPVGPKTRSMVCDVVKAGMYDIIDMHCWRTWVASCCEELTMRGLIRYVPVAPAPIDYVSGGGGERGKREEEVGMMRGGEEERG